MSKKLGVVVGRFDTPYLHKGHKALIQHAIDNSDYVLVILGESASRPFFGYCLPAELRRQMIEAEFPDVSFSSIRNMKSNEAWSEQLDGIIQVFSHLNGDDWTNGGLCGTSHDPAEPTLYSGRDGFQSLYQGKYPVEEVNFDLDEVSATKIRSRINAQDSVEFRAGFMYAHKLREPQLYQTVDIAVVKGNEVLLGRKPNSNEWVFPGGFVDPGETLEQAASRELKEETGLDLRMYPDNYLGSFVGNDWRYRVPGGDRITTALYHTAFSAQADLPVKAGDDLTEVKWFPLLEINNVLTENHKQFIHSLYALHCISVSNLGETLS